MANDTRTAQLYRMVLPDHVCPFGLAAKERLESEGFEVEDHLLETRGDTEAFKAEHGLETTPLIVIDGKEIGGYDDLQRYLEVAS